MLMKTKNIRNPPPQKKKIFCFKLKKKLRRVWSRESKNQNLKEIHAIGSEIIDATDGRRTDGGTTDEF